MDALDAEYHRVISEQDFRVLGNVYYNGGTERLDAAPSGPALLNYVLKGAPDEPTQTPPHP